MEQIDHNSKSLGEVMKAMLKAPGIRKNYLRVIARMTWEDKMGALIVSHTKRMSLRKGVLTVTVDSDALRHELLYNRDSIRSMMNESFGEWIVQEVRIE